jgi:hypothetical protein
MNRRTSVLIGAGGFVVAAVLGEDSRPSEAQTRDRVSWSYETGG